MLKLVDKLRRDEGGSILIFTLVVFLTIVLVGGTAIDLARHETLRTTMQYNLDRAVLAAASLKQTKVPSDVVNDYMGKVTTLEEISVVTNYDTGLNFRAVSATATADLTTMFMNIAGISSMPIIVSSSAEERIPHLEISLVLDVSGSMGGNSKLTNLKTAAKQFVSTMLTDVDDDHVAISIIPFNNSVAPSVNMYNALNVNDKHDYSTCLDFTDADFRNVQIDPNVTQNQLIYTSLYGGWTWGDSSNLDRSSRTCFTEDYFVIMPYSDDEAALHAKIDGLQAEGWTAGHLGMKWGAAMLDPSFRPVTNSLIAALDVDSGFASIPVEYDDHDTLKVIIMMGDGANTYEFRMGPNYQGAGSELWEVKTAEMRFWYAQHKKKAWRTSTSESKCGRSRWICFYKPVSGSEVSTYYMENQEGSGDFLDIENDDWISASDFHKFNEDLTGWISTTQLDWEDAWGLMPAQWRDRTVSGGSSFNDLVYGTGRTGSEADAAMAESCLAAQNAGLIVYTIGFETSSSTSAKLRSCATTSAHYYDAYGIQISAVFAQIAASIQKLKLTQ